MKLNKIWNDFDCLMQIPMCICNYTCCVTRKLVEMNDAYHFWQFLIGLNGIYAMICSQFLVMEPLPSSSKAYSMLLKVEKQLEVHLALNDNDNIV